MKIRNSTKTTLKICQGKDEMTLEEGKSSLAINRDLAAVEVHRLSPSELKLGLQGKTGADGSHPDGGTDDGTRPALMTDGGDRTGHGWRNHPVEVVNSTGKELRLRIERTIPDKKALRIVGPPELFDVTEDDGGICVTLRSREP